MASDASSIVVDWGTTSFRATLVTDAGDVLDQIKTQQGVSTLKMGDHENILMETLQPWFQAHGALPVVALGMVTSRNGWIEVDYVPCPAGPAELSAGTVNRVLPNGSKLMFLPGLTDPARKPFPDVMRGEETQVVGYGLDRELTVVLPGTHSKWARIENGRIDHFQTFVTGEIFALLINHSFIARSTIQPPVEDPAAFRRGLEEAEKTGPMLSLLFSARTGVLANALSAQEIRSYVSGLVIGQEFRQAREEGWFSAGDTIAIVGNDGLNALYGVAAGVFGLTAPEAPGNEAIRGALAVLRAPAPILASS